MTKITKVVCKVYYLDYLCDFTGHLKHVEESWTYVKDRFMYAFGIWRHTTGLNSALLFISFYEFGQAPPSLSFLFQMMTVSTSLWQD